MKREDTYTIYRSEARGEAVRDARNTSEGKKSFIRMKQKFLPKETAVPSEGNFAHLGGSYRPACKLFALITALLLLGANWNGVWGQYEGYTINHHYASNYGQSTEVLYVRSGEDKTVSFQDAGAADNLDGYIRWYIQSGTTVTTEGLVDNNSLAKYQNGLVWYRTALNGNAPGGACEITLDVSELDLTKENILIVEASGMNNVDTRTENIGGSFNPNWITYIANSPQITFQRKYIIRSADTDETNITKLKSNLDNASAYDNWKTSAEEFRALAALSDEERRSYFIESYELHTPLAQYYTDDGQPAGTNYRVSRKLDNYNLPGSGDYSSNHYTASRIRWNVFKANGNKVTYKETDYWGNETKYEHIESDNIWQHTFTNAAEGIDENANTPQTIYLVAEVANAVGDTYRSDWYPVAFIKVILEPNAGAIIQSDLDDYEANTTSPYYKRTDKYLEDNNYKEITSITFDNDIHNGDISSLQPSENYSSTPLQNATTYYAYAYPGEYEHRRKHRYSVGRGEYGLYRTLNYTDISEGQIGGGMYNDYFAKDYTKTDYDTNQGRWRYNKWIADRLYDRTKNTGNTQMGYFMYLDAADTPGTIANIKLPDDLCPDMKLVVSAWICDMAFKVYNSDDDNVVSNADVSFSFKGITASGDEVILNRYQSGRISNNPYEFGRKDYKQANWQQVYFSFTFERPEERFVSYVIEIANNAASSTGADYAIDDIRIYRSTPNIEVIREEACDASTLTISSDYETLLANMDWIAGQDISDIQKVYDNAELIKYRFGLQGDANSDNYPVLEETFGNTYFSFLEGLYENENGNLVIGNYTNVTATNQEDKLGEKEYRWIRINKDLQVSAPAQSVYSLRVVVSTEKDKIPNTYQAAQEEERKRNFRALKDYNYAVENWDAVWEDSESVPDKPDWLDQKIEILEDITEDNINDHIDIYAELMQQLYGKLQIPRIRVPWLRDNTLYLSRVDVASTDLRYVGEILGYDDQGKSITADGRYQVILFDALQVENGVVEEEGFLNEDCNLISEFFVRRPVRITVETDPDVEGMICAGTQRQITAELINVETGEPLDESYYGFDWFLGTEESYYALTTANTFGENVTLKNAIETYRRENSDTDEITEQEIRDWNTTSYSEMKDGLLSVYNSLRTDMTDYTIILETDTIIAMPFIKREFDDALYCTEITPVPFDAMSDDVPEIHPGIGSVSYPTELTDTPVRLGLRHIHNTTDEFTIPLRKDIAYSVETDEEGKPVDNSGHELRELQDNKDIFWEDEKGTFPTVATVVGLYATEDGENNYVTLKFTENAANKLTAEGKEYILRVPFGEYENASATTSLGATCDGLAELHIKIVPEYLTWQEAGQDWYNESTDAGSWKQSNEEELYMGNRSAIQDVNGDDDVTVFTYSPLYFTKITVLDGEELPLVDPTTDANETSAVANIGNIKYEMAIDTVRNSEAKYQIKPYYINKVEQIYFKPNALLKNQQYLNYEKAWVEFEMKKGEKYWLSSPLKDVFAGDMYAPTGTGRQTTPAFADITYRDKTNSGNYDRWNPAFYQKAWDKSVTYYTESNGSKSETVSAVQSNWSIEYNDVNVPYSLGKGFYASVEGDFENDKALVRLPKADNNYSYYTKAASTIETRSNAGELAGNEPIIITLIDSDEKNTWGDNNEYADGDGKHFLLGNPYMYPLDVEKFFSGNLKEGSSSESVFAPKYWILGNGASTAIVGTPDVDWEGNETEDGTEDILGQIPPMTAFFVELKEPLNETTSSVDIKFTTSMMADNAEITRSVDTKSLTASNPILTLTAERGETRSVARLLTSDKGHDAYEASEDAVILLDSELDAPMVYTVAGDVAAQFNTMQSIKNVPLGVYADKGEEVELTIRGISQFAEKLYLYDAVTKQSTPLDDDSYTFRVTGPSHGRFTLTSQNRISAESDICVYAPTPGQLLVMSSPEEPLQRVQVYDMSGRMVTSRDNVRNTTCQLTVPSGIYVVYAENETGNVRVKVRVR